MGNLKRRLVLLPLQGEPGPPGVGVQGPQVSLQPYACLLASQHFPKPATHSHLPPKPQSSACPQMLKGTALACGCFCWGLWF